MAVNAVHLDHPLVVDEAADGLEQGALAGTVGADDGDQFAAAHAERHVEQGALLAVAHPEVVYFERCSSHVQPKPFRSAARFAFMSDT